MPQIVRLTTPTIYAFLLALSLFTGMLTQQGNAQTVLPKDAIAAVVNDTVISAQALLRRAALNRRQFSGDLTSTEEAKLLQEALYELIDERLKITHAESVGFTASVPELARAQAQLEQLNSLPPGTYQKLIQGLEAEAITKLRADVLWQKVLAGMNISGADKALLAASATTENTPEPKRQEVELSQIFITENDRRAIDALALQLETGMATFADVASQHNADASAKRGGYVGWVSEDTLAPNLQAALQSMQAGDISAPLQSPAGWHIIRLERLKQRSAKAFAPDALSRQQAMARRQQKARQLLDDLREEAFIEVKLGQ